MMPDQIQNWVGREEFQRDVIDAGRAQRMRALLNQSADDLQPGTPLPPGYHWLYCASITPRMQWGEDGHARRGGFLPPLEGSRRMWASGSLRFLQPLQIGAAVERHSTVSAIEAKEGRSGRFHIVRIQHRISGPAGLAIEEQQNLVYLPANTRSVTAPSPPLSEPTDWSETFVADEVVLFFFSALTMNGHRIHYDYRYATEVEGYRGLLVHAPLTALLLLDAAHRHGATGLHGYSFRAVAPLFCRDAITLAGRSSSLWALRDDGSIAMAAEVRSTA